MVSSKSSKSSKAKKKHTPQRPPFDPEKLSKVLAELGTALRKKTNDPEFLEKLKMRMGERVKASTEAEGPGIPAVEGSLRKPDDMANRVDRLQFYWHLEYPANSISTASTVIASYSKEDSVNTEDVLLAKPGARAGDWTIDIVGYNGAALFHQRPDQAKHVAEAILSAVGWEHVWREYVGDFATMSTVEGGEMSHIPHDDSGPAVPGTFTTTVVDGVGNELTVVDDVSNELTEPGGALHKCCGHCNQAQDTHAPHSDGCPTPFLR